MVPDLKCNLGTFSKRFVTRRLPFEESMLPIRSLPSVGHQASANIELAVSEQALPAEITGVLPVGPLVHWPLS